MTVYTGTPIVNIPAASSWSSWIIDLRVTTQHVGAESDDRARMEKLKRMLLDPDSLDWGALERADEAWGQSGTGE